MLATYNVLFPSKWVKQKLWFSRQMNYHGADNIMKRFEVIFWHLIIVLFHGLIFDIFIIHLFWMRPIREQVEIISSLLPLYVSRNPIPGMRVGGELLYPMTYLTSHPALLSLFHFPLPTKEAH